MSSAMVWSIYVWSLARLTRLIPCSIFSLLIYLSLAFLLLQPPRMLISGRCVMHPSAIQKRISYVFVTDTDLVQHVTWAGATSAARPRGNCAAVGSLPPTYCPVFCLLFCYPLRIASVTSSSAPSTANPLGTPGLTSS